MFLHTVTFAPTPPLPGELFGPASVCLTFTLIQQESLIRNSSSSNSFLQAVWWQTLILEKDDRKL